MSETGHKAVFLSYASQDVAAALKICDALRAAGVEVWFDQSELRGGDAWDQKIRRQIKECALFMPVISANSQARLEGYFRLEWKLAAQRTHTMADAKPFLVPICIDNTRDGEAHVPEEFRAVQWTQLAGGKAGEAFCAQVRTLLAGEVGARPPPTASVRDAGGGARAPRKSDRRLWPFAVAMIAVLLAIALWRPWRMGESSKAARPMTAPVSDARKLAQQAKALLDDDLMRVRENFLAAERLCRRAISLDPGETEAWAVSARANLTLYVHYQDRTTERYEAARSAAETALRLAPDSIEAGFAFAVFENSAGSASAALARLEALAQRAPQDRRIFELGTRIHFRANRAEEGEMWAKRAESLPGGSTVVLIERANYHWVRSELPQMQDCIDRALALRTTSEGLHYKLLLLTWGWGDLAAARALRSKLPSSLLQEDNVALMAYHSELWSRQFDRAVAELERIRRDFLEEYSTLYPRGYLIGEALHHAGKTRAAEIQWRNALKAVDGRMSVEPNSARLLVWKAKLLARLGETTEAEKYFAAAAELGDSDGRTRYTHVLAVEKAVLLGRPDEAIDAAERRLARTSPRWVLALNDLRFDPIFDPLRSHPRFQALIADGEASLAELRRSTSGANTSTADAAIRASEPPAATPDPKSVVVLPFANLSGDAAQEYFSDGLTEEILNALARERDLRVVPRTSAFSFKGKNLPAAEIARALNVAQVVEGSVQRVGNRVRIRCTLASAADGFFAAALTPFDREIRDGADFFALQDDVAAAVREKLTRRVGTIAPAAVLTRNPDAYDAFLQGRTLMNQTSPSWPRGADAFRRAVALDPQFAHAWAKLGQVSAMLYAYGFEGKALAESERALREALRLKPDLPASRLAEASYLRATNATPAAIERAITAAEGKRPDDPEILQVRAELLLARGNDEEGIMTLRRAAAVDPRNGPVLNMLGNALSADGRYAEAETAYRRAFDVLGSSIPFTNRARIYFHWQGDAALATRTLDEVPEEIRNERYWTSRALLFYVMDDQPAALAAAARMQERSAFFRIRSFFTAKMRAASGDLVGARRDYLEALPLAEQQREEFRALPTPYAILALVYAALDRKTEALETARKAVELGRLQPGRNASAEGRTGMGALTLVDLELSSEAALAQVQARFGLVDDALAIVAANVAAGHWRRNNLLRNPDWALLRNDSRFRAIAEKAPL